MILFPAVDIKGSKCVRLRQGIANEETVFGPDPVAMAVHWQEQGAKWLHVIDLDGSFDGKPVNQNLVKNICAKLSIPVQLGGGVRSLETAKRFRQEPEGSGNSQGPLRSRDGIGRQASPRPRYRSGSYRISPSPGPPRAP